MCGRYALFGPVSRRSRDIQERYFAGLDGIPPRYNIAPDQGGSSRPNPEHIPIVRMRAGDIEVAWVQWWLLPFWSRERFIKLTTFNARIETVATAASFREPFKHRRCIVPASGYYEWRDIPGEKRKQPWFIHDAAGGYLGFAGIWDRWHHGDEVVESCAIIVQDRDEATKHVHERMPVILAPELYGDWLNPDIAEPQRLIGMLHANPGVKLARHRVSPAVNNSRNEGEELVRSIDDA